VRGGERAVRIGVASDHAGFRYKSLVARHLRELGHEVEDFGAASEEPVDYPDFVRPLAAAVAGGALERGFVFGGSGNGEAMAANRFPGVRCAVSWSTESARLARAHNDANVLSIGQRLVPEDSLLAIVDTWLETPFDGGRHVARIRKVDAGHTRGRWPSS
jgi:ribose 5-phosphate isomerase B